MPSLVPCGCSTCPPDAKVSSKERSRHHARDRRLASTPTTAVPQTSLDNTSTNSPLYLSSTLSTPFSIPDVESNGPASPLLSPPTAPHASPPSALHDMDVFNIPEAEVQHIMEELEAIVHDDWEDPVFDEDDDEFASVDSTDATTTSTSVEPSVEPSMPLVAPSSTESQPVVATADTEPPDPFHNPASPTSSFPTPQQVHPNRAVYIIYLLVFWLHSQCHLPFRICNAILTCFALILRVVGVIFEPPALTTLPSVINTLGGDPTFQIAPICPKCMRVFPPSSPVDACCSHCSIPLFPPKPPHSPRNHKPRPLFQFPFKSLEEQLAAMLSVPGIEDIIEEAPTKMKSSEPGVYTSIFDGTVCQELKCADGTPFFTPNADAVAAGELRIGVTLGVDWFSYLRSQIAPSHTSCPMSYSIINLPPHLRYRTANLLLAGIMPGPKEANMEQVHYFLSILVNELLRLWKHGAIIKTSKYPNGRLVRVALVAVVCDKPAAHKLGGFGSHTHKFFCTMCWVTQELKADARSFTKDGFRARTGEEQRRLQERYLALNTQKARADFVKNYATRWTELNRLPYFDICRMIVIDPMHNLFLGLVKTHFYHIWVQLNVLRKTKELRRLHEILAELRMPAKLGRLPSLIGEPAGGSLTADQWLVFATVVAPLAIPQIWQEYLPESDSTLLARRQETITTTIAERQAVAATKRAASKKKKGELPAISNAEPRPKRKRNKSARALEMDVDPDAGLDAGALQDEDDDDYDMSSHKQKRPRKHGVDTTAEDEPPDNATACNLSPEDPNNFMKLSLALQILTARVIREADLEKADQHLREYCTGLVKLYGPGVIRPNHHYAVHTPESVRNYGPLHEFWTFLFERLNKVLKSYKTSNHAGGELEVSFFREFHRTVQVSRLLGRGMHDTSYPELQLSIAAMYKATADDRGTVQALSQELDEAQEDEGIRFCLSPRFEDANMPPDLYPLVYRQFLLQYPTAVFHYEFTIPTVPNSLPLYRRATFFDYVIIQNTRYSASRRSRVPAEGYVSVSVNPQGHQYVGELLEIFLVDLPTLGRHYFGRVRWLTPANVNISKTTWDEFKALGVRLWVADAFLPNETGPGVVIGLEQIICPVVRHTVQLPGHVGAYWATVRIDRHSSQTVGVTL